MSEMKQERFDQPHLFDNYLGHQDLELHPLWEKAWIGQDKATFEQVIYDMGADLNYGYEFSICLHRARTNNKVEHGMRVAFKERTDREWMRDMMDVSDIVRLETRSIVTTGMRLSLNEDRPMDQMMANANLYNYAESFDDNQQ